MEVSHLANTEGYGIRVVTEVGTELLLILHGKDIDVVESKE